MLTKNLSEVISHIEKEENPLMPKEIQDMNIEETCLQEQEIEEMYQIIIWIGK
ncbi:15900_t:CDS:1, partial [Cetraspora pellucida]